MTDSKNYVPYHKLDWNNIKDFTGAEIKFLLHFREFHGVFYENFDVILRKFTHIRSYRSQLKSKLGHYIEEVTIPGGKSKISVPIVNATNSTDPDDIVFMPSGLSLTDISGYNLKLILNPHKTARQRRSLKSKMEESVTIRNMVMANKDTKRMGFDIYNEFDLPPWVFELSFVKRFRLSYFEKCGRLLNIVELRPIANTTEGE